MKSNICDTVTQIYSTTIPFHFPPPPTSCMFQYFKSPQRHLVTVFHSTNAQQLHSLRTPSSSTLPTIIIPMSGAICMVSEGVWMMSRWCLRVSGEASIPNLLAKTLLSYDTQILHFLSMPCTYCIILSYFLRCLYCVWECLGEV